ncbi:hypothetical protein LTR08_006495 [Meristemomyces frigidus]|nr:hypothetical protein LTR08_006495 [Meristemomyces frigidus]
MKPSTTTALLATLLLTLTAAAPTLDTARPQRIVRHAARAAQALPPYPSNADAYAAGFYPTASSFGSGYGTASSGLAFASGSGYAFASSGSGYALPSGSAHAHPSSSSPTNTTSTSTHPPISVLPLPASSSHQPPAPTSPPPPPLPSTGTNTTACAPNGALVCHGLYQFGLCNWGHVVWQDVALGTACYDGRIGYAAGYGGT